MGAFVLLAALLIGVAAPARAANDVATAQATAQAVIASQIEAFGRSNGSTAA
jgi:hypothetical protein